jgi:hypothetical protein
MVFAQAHAFGNFPELGLALVMLFDKVDGLFDALVIVAKLFVIDW